MRWVALNGFTLPHQLCEVEDTLLPWFLQPLQLIEHRNRQQPDWER